MYIADYLSCYVHLAKTCNGDSRIADIFHLAILRWGGDDVEHFFRLVCSIQSKKSGGRQETSAIFRHHKWFCKDDNITCTAEEVVVKNPIQKNKTSKVKVKNKGQMLQNSKLIQCRKVYITMINERIRQKK